MEIPETHRGTAMPTMKMKQRATISPEGSFIRIYAAPHPNDPLELSGDELMSFRYSELSEAVMDEVEFHELLGHVGALEIAAQFERVATSIRDFIKNLHRPARNRRLGRDMNPRHQSIFLALAMMAAQPTRAPEQPTERIEERIHCPLQPSHDRRSDRPLQ